MLWDATKLPIRNETVAAVVTSPPYNCDVDYPVYDDNLSWAEYEKMAVTSCQEIIRVLKPGGRAWVVVQPAVPTEDGRFCVLKTWLDALLGAGLKFRDITCWVQDSFDGACAWGSWLSPSAPNQRGGWESIICVYKDHWKRTPPSDMRGWRDEREACDDDWTDMCRNVWKINPARNKNYPAVFPPKLAERCIRLSTWPGEIVLDPFSGTGTTQIVAERLGRIGVGGDLHDQ